MTSPSSNGDGAPSTWLFNVLTPLGFRIHTTREYWDFIVTVKHPILTDRIEIVILALEDPDEIRQSLSDENVFLFYRKDLEFPWICAVVKDGHNNGYLITAYPTDKIMRGNIIWKK